MNSQIAITLLKDLEQSLDDYCELNDEGKTAFSMAITALELFGISEQLPSVHPELSNNSPKLDSENGELISREEAIKAVKFYETFCDPYPRVIEALEELPSAQPETNCSEIPNNSDLISREYMKSLGATCIASRSKDGNMFPIVSIDELPSVQPKQKWETCFGCPLSHGCPKINGCTNSQTMEYASEVPDDCPISVQPRKGKWTRHFDGNEWYWYCSSCKEQWYEEDLWMGGNSFPNFCPNCGCRMEEGDSE